MGAVGDTAAVDVDAEAGSDVVARAVTVPDDGQRVAVVEDVVQTEVGPDAGVLLALPRAAISSTMSATA